VVPAGANLASVTLVGGGGGASSTSIGGGGGSIYGYKLNVVPGGTITYTVGAGGAPGFSGSNTTLQVSGPATDTLIAYGGTIGSGVAPGGNTLIPDLNGTYAQPGTQPNIPGGGGVSVYQVGGGSVAGAMFSSGSLTQGQGGGSAFGLEGTATTAPGIGGGAYVNAPGFNTGGPGMLVVGFMRA